MKLNKKQTRALDFLEDKITTEVLFGGSAGGGKSILGCYWLTKMCLKYPGTRWVMGRESMKTLKETTLVSFFKVARIQKLRAGIDFHYIDNPKNIIIFNNGSIILLKDLGFYPSDPNFDELGSLEITGAFIDEANQCVEKAVNVLFSRIRHMLDEYDLIPKMLYTCNPAKNWVYKKFYKPFKDKTIAIYRQFIQAFVTDNPDISKHYRENLLKLDKASQERLLYGNWEYDDDPATMIIYDKIMDMYTNIWISGENEENYLTIDVARFGKDKTVFFVWKGFRCKIFSYPKTSITDTVAIAKRLMWDHHIPLSNVIADEDGVGGGVVDVLKCKGFVNNSIALEEATPDGVKKPNYYNLKSQCYFHLAYYINNNLMFVECEETEIVDHLNEELEQVKRMDVDKDGKLRVVSKEIVKEKLGRSPDYSDAMMMRMYFILAPVYHVGAW